MAAEPPQEVNLLSWGEGALVVPPAPAESRQGQWSADVLLDEVPETGWANPRGDMTPKSLVFELAASGRITHFVFNTAQAFSAARSAKDLKIEISDHATGGYVEIAHATLAQLKDGQRVALAKPASGRYLRLTVLNGYGDTSFMELMDVEAFGSYLKPPPARDVTPTRFARPAGADARAALARQNYCVTYEAGASVADRACFAYSLLSPYARRKLRAGVSADQSSRKRFPSPSGGSSVTVSRPMAISRMRPISRSQCQYGLVGPHHLGGPEREVVHDCAHLRIRARRRRVGFRFGPPTLSLLDHLANRYAQCLQALRLLAGGRAMAWFAPREARARGTQLRARERRKQGGP